MDVLFITIITCMSSSQLELFVTWVQANKWRREFNKVSLPSTSAAVIRFLGSCVNILLTRSLALLEMEGHGSDAKSISPRNTSSNIPFSFSEKSIQTI